MKRILIPVVVLLVIAFVITGCGTSTTTTTPAATTPAATTPSATTPAATTPSETTPAATTPAATTPSSTTPAATTPSSTTPAANVVTGGTLRIITAAGPQFLGYVPDMGPSDAGAVFPVVERLMDASSDRSQGDGMVPVLAQSVDDDTANNCFVFHLRPNVTFSDGSPMNADAVIWNFNQLINAGALQYQSYFRGIKKLDDMTVEIDYTKYTNQLLPSWGWTAIMSEAAWNKASNGNLQQGIAWARDHVVGTGPFILQDFVTDDHMDFVKNPNYWQPGLPYLDGINVRFIPDATTAENIMLAGQADEWDSPTPQDTQYLISKGFVAHSGYAGLIYDIWPNTVNTSSPFYNSLPLREALDYALNKPAIAKALGFGYYQPLDQLAPQGEWGYDPNYQARSYDPAKAKQLVAEAGYPNGIKVTMLIGNDSVSVDTGTALQQYLDAVGINTTLDEADPGRYYGEVYGNTVPSDDMAWMFSGMDINYLMTYMRWFSTDPFTNIAFLGRTAQQQQLDLAAESASSAADQQAQALIVYGYLNNNARVIPVYKQLAVVVTAPYVHTTRMSQGFVRWQSEIVWMDKH